jgi:hypothetical protein
MGSLLFCIGLFATGFYFGWRFGYKEVLSDIDRVIKRANQSK